MNDTSDAADMSDPSIAEGRDHHAFWADKIADHIEDRTSADPIVIKGAISPSGIPHVGNFNEIMYGYYVAEVLRERGHEVRQIFTTDDRDALRKLPRRLADAEWNIVELGDVDAGALGRNLGVPYTDIPDPFGECHGSYGDHFSELIEDGAKQLGVSIEVRSMTALYEQGAFDELIHKTLKCKDLAREILSEYQESVDETYVPFMPICSSCDRELTTTVTDVDLEQGTVRYGCTGGETADQDIDGCGHEGTADLRNGKLPWRFEWPAGWAVLNVDFEPFGKDHAEGSWPSGQEIARELYEIEPPVPMTYEWFTLNGEALSSSTGNVVTVPELLELIEPEVLRYFFAKNPRKQRDINLREIDQLVDEFDRFEERYFGDREGTEQEQAFAERAYPFIVEQPRADRVRLPYTFAAVLGMTDDRDLRLEIANREGHITDETPEWAIEDALARVQRARTWAKRMDNEYNYRIQSTQPAVDFSPPIDAALDELAEIVLTEPDGDTLQEAIYETARAYEIQPSELFAAGYQLFFGQEQGPRLGPFLVALDEEFVVDRLRRKR